MIAMLAATTASILFTTGWGTGPYDSWKYGHYESETLHRRKFTISK